MSAAHGDTSMRSRPSTLVRIGVALSVAACATPVAPAGRGGATGGPGPSAAASGVAPPQQGAEVPATCRPLRAAELPPLFSQPGLEVFELNDCYPSYTLAGHVACLPDRAELPLVLVPVAGGPARSVYAEGLQFDRYVAGGSVTQSSLMVVAGPSEACAPGIYAFDPSTLEARWYLASSYAWKPGPLATNRSVWGGEDAGLLALRTLSAPEGAAASSSQLMVVRATTGEVVWQRLVPSTAHVVSFSGLVLLERGDSLVALSVAQGRELWHALLTEAPTATDAQGDLVAAIVQRSSSSALERPERCLQRPCAFDLQVFDANSGRLRWRASLGSSDFSYGALKMGGSDVYVEAPAEARGFPASRLAAFDVQTGRERWSATPVVCAAEHASASFALTPSILYSCTCDGTLRAISRADGRLISEWGAGYCDGIFAAEGGLLLSTRSRLARIDWAALPPARDMTVRGQVKLDGGLKLTFPRWVRVGPALVKTDGAGRFRTALRGRGDYSADLAVAPGEPIEAATVVFTIDRHRGEVVLTPTARSLEE
jgi:outer membrane protein assembly factor BamB